MPIVEGAPAELPSLIIEDRGFNQQGYFSVDDDGNSVSWDDEGARGLCMLGAMYLGFGLHSQDFDQGDPGEAIMARSSPGAFEYLTVVLDIVQDQMAEIPEVGEHADHTAAFVIARFSDDLENPDIAYRVLVEAEVRLDLRPVDDLSKVQLIN